VERVGRGRWGEVHLCHLQTTATSSALVAVSSLEPGAPPEERALFLAEARGLARLRSPALASVLGLGLQEEPLLRVTEAGHLADLNAFLQVPSRLA
jgi:hypothetical protein